MFMKTQNPFISISNINIYLYLKIKDTYTGVSFSFDSKNVTFEGQPRREFHNFPFI
jgi:hypothetical protein